MKSQSWVLKENKAGKGADSPRFLIEYGQNRRLTENQTASYQIITLLKAGADLVVKLDSSLFNGPAKEREEVVLNFIAVLQSAGLQYRYRKYLGPAAPNLWNQLLPGRKEEYRHEVWAYLPDQVWRRQHPFDSGLICPLGHGTFYYVCKTSGADPAGENSLILDAFFDGRITRDNQNSFFDLIIFDWIYFGQMGLFTGSLTLADLRGRLFSSA